MDIKSICVLVSRRIQICFLDFYLVMCTLFVSVLDHEK